MADRRRIVTLDNALAPTTVLDLEDGTVMYALRNTWTIAPGAPLPILATRSRPRGGSRRVGESHENGTLSANLYVKGTSADNAVANAENLFAVLRGPRADLFYEWRADGATNSTFYEIRGPATVAPNYSRVQFAQAPFFQVSVTIPIGPVAVSGKTTVTLPTNTSLPAVFPLGTVAGSAPAIADVQVTNGAGAQRPFGLIAWAPHAVYNMMVNPSFQESGTPQAWSVAAVPSYSVAATSATASAGSARTGSAKLQIVTTATNLSGANFRLYSDVFRQGVTYTAEAWVLAGTSGENVRIAIGSAATTADSAFGAIVALGASYQRISVTWTPTADRKDAVVVVQINDASPVATTIIVDDVAVYEGTTAPAGADGRVPFGIIHAATATPGGNLAPAAGGLAGTYLEMALASTSNASVSFPWVLPSLLAPDDYSSATLEVEVWMSLNLPSTLVSPVATMSFQAEGAATSVIRTSEYGAAGRGLIVPFSGNGYRLCRMGTAFLPIDPVYKARWRPFVSFTWAASTGTFGVDYMLLVPSRSRALSPTGKQLSATTYPVFVGNSAVKRILGADLAGLETVTTSNVFALGVGLGGSPIELPAGRAVDLLLAMYSTVPDDPSVITGGNVVGGDLMSAGSVDITQRQWLAR